MVLYDAQGNPVPVSQNGAGGFVLPPAPAAAGPSTATPAAAASANYRPATQQVQGVAEYVDGGDVQGGDVHVPFGPVITMPTDGDGQPAAPSYPYQITPDGPRRTFRLAQTVGLMPLMRFANAAKSGGNTDDLEGMAALYTMIQDCVDPADWGDFQAYATVIKAQDEELLDFVSAAMEVISARPRQRRGSSSATAPRTSGKSKAGSSRPDSVIPPGAIRPPEVDGLMPVADLVR